MSTVLVLCVNTVWMLAKVALHNIAELCRATASCVQPSHVSAWWSPPAPTLPLADSVARPHSFLALSKAVVSLCASRDAAAIPCTPLHLVVSTAESTAGLRHCLMQ